MVMWADVEDLLDPTDPYAVTALETASWILYQLTGEKYQGIITTTEAYGGVPFGANIEPAVVNGKMYNLPTSGNKSSLGSWIGYGLNKLKLHLKHGPVRKVLEVVELGAVVPQSSYTLRDNSFIKKKNNLPWIMNDFTELLVTYEYGAKPPKAGKQAAIRLANEFLLFESNDDRCALPAAVTSIQRQGVSVTVLDPQEFLMQGRTGIYEVDLFIRTANPKKALKKSKLYVPGRVRGERIN